MSPDGSKGETVIINEKRSKIESVKEGGKDGGRKGRRKGGQRVWMKFSVPLTCTRQR